MRIFGLAKQWKKFLAGLWVFFCPFICQAETRVEVGQIEIIGVTRFSSTDIEATLDIGVGDFFERGKLIRTAQNIQDLYRSNGYEKINIQSNLVQRTSPLGKKLNVLKIIVSEGKPTRVAKVDVRLFNIKNEAIKKEWKDLKKALVDQISVKTGDILNDDRVSDMRRSFENYLASQRFVGAKVVETKMRSHSAPSDQNDLNSETERWVGVEFIVELGDKVSFGFRNQKSLAPSELNDLVEEQRQIGFGENYVQDVRKRIIEKYHSMGFANVQIEVYTFEKTDRHERHITFFINEGKRVRIESIDFEGNLEYSSDELKEHLYDRSPPMISRGYFVEKGVETAAQFLIDWYKSQGFLSARLLSISRTYVPKNNSVRLLFYLYEGEQTLIRNIFIEGNTVLSTETIKKYLAIQEEKPLNLFSFTEGFDVLKSAYRSQAYLDMEIRNENKNNVVLYYQKNRVADIRLEINEGPRFRVSSIEILGLEKTHEHIAKRELLFEVGDYLNEALISRSESKLRKLGIFSSVSIQHRPDLEKEDHKQVKVILKEGTPGLVAGGPGFRTDLGVRLFAEVAYTNLWARNHTWSLTGSVNRRIEDFRYAEYRFRMGYRWPWFGLPKVTFRPSLTQEKKQYIQFDAQTTSFAAALERPIWESANLIAGLTYNLERTRQFNAVNQVDNQTLTIGALIPSVRLDLRDNPLAPLNGFFSSASFEYAHRVFGTQTFPFAVGYHKAILRADQFISFFQNRLTFYVSFRTGFARNNINPLRSDGTNDGRIGIPLSKQFALGGAGSLRGFKLQELNVQDTVVQGTLSFVNYRAQLDFPISGGLRFGPFYDVGNLVIDRYTLFEQLRHGWGFGLHYMTPVGPVNFDWGFKLRPRPGEEPNQFYFSIGVL